MFRFQVFTVFKSSLYFKTNQLFQTNKLKKYQVQFEMGSQKYQKYNLVFIYFIGSIEKKSVIRKRKKCIQAIHSSKMNVIPKAISQIVSMASRQNAFEAKNRLVRRSNILMFLKQDL